MAALALYLVLLLMYLRRLKENKCCPRKPCRSSLVFFRVLLRQEKLANLYPRTRDKISFAANPKLLLRDFIFVSVLLFRFFLMPLEICRVCESPVVMFTVSRLRKHAESQGRVAPRCETPVCVCVCGPGANLSPAVRVCVCVLQLVD